ncbi:GTP-binding protein [Mariniluteicoccus flavus]
MRRRGATPIIVLAALDQVARDAAAFGLLVDLPGAVLVRHDLTALDGSVGGRVRRLVTDAGGVVWDDSSDLGHACLNCAVREDIVPTLQRVVDAGRWSAVVLALPLTAAPEPVAYEVDAAIGAGDLAARIAAAVTVVDPETLVDDLFGDELIAERGDALVAGDPRAVGEALAAQLDFADVVATLDRPESGEAAVLDHLVSPTARWTTLADLDAPATIAAEHHFARAQARIDAVDRAHTPCADGDGVWTLDLASDRPLHPGRLLEQIELLGSGLVRGRGCFWLPTRPQQVCAWDGAGGQLAIGPGGVWGRRTPRSRLLVTGIDLTDRDRIARAHADVLMTDFELARLWDWRGRPDGFDPWLGVAEARDAG